MSRTITYCIDVDGFVYSRVGSEVAIPVLDYAGCTAASGWKLAYRLETFPVTALAGQNWLRLTWTRKIPREVKNEHRRYWGMREL